MVYIDKESLEGMLPSLASRTQQPTYLNNEETEEAQEAFKKIQRLVKVHDRSVSATYERLERDGFSAQASQTAINRALACGFLDDERFADVLVRSRLRAGKGLEGIIRELKGHSIDPYELLQDFPDAYLERVPSQSDAAFDLLCRKPPRAKNAQQAAYAKLIRSGYPSSIASEAARKWYETRRSSSN